MSDILPSDQKAEQALLGSCLIDPTVFFRVVIEPDDFYIVSHKEIWKAISEILKKGNLDYITLTNYLKSKNKLDEIGGHSYITQLLTPYCYIPERRGLRQNCSG
jgi:replicative DNA helicase